VGAGIKGGGGNGGILKESVVSASSFLTLSNYSCYNCSYNKGWCMTMASFEKLYTKRLNFVDNIVLSLHCVTDKMPLYNIDEDDIVKAYKGGKLYREKCEQPNKLALSRYDGKNKKTIILIVTLNEGYAKVVTLWVQKGRL